MTANLTTLHQDQLEHVAVRILFAEAIGSKAIVVLQILGFAIVISTHIAQVAILAFLRPLPTATVTQVTRQEEVVAGFAGGQILSVAGEDQVAIIVHSDRPDCSIFTAAAGEFVLAGCRGGQIHLIMIGRIDFHGLAVVIHTTAAGADAVHIIVPLLIAFGQTTVDALLGGNAGGISPGVTLFAVNGIVDGIFTGV